MIHNGIEYGDMQLISEAYHIMRDLLHLTTDEMYRIFNKWNESELGSYLIEITADILACRDDDGLPLIDKILDKAEQKGTGKWTAITALDMGVPLTLIGEAVFSRCLSAAKEERVNASKILKGPKSIYKGDKSLFINDLKKALYASKIVSYTQGYSLMRAASEEFGWMLNYGGIALLWRSGCIIRSEFLNKIKEAYESNPSVTNLLLDKFFKEKIENAQTGWRNVVSVSILNGIPVPTLSSALAYFDAYRCENLPANLIQAQRDFFGAHTYQRTDKPGGEFFHTNWTGRGG
jgi:6-phosphogluconate dehydrogenase